MSREITKMESLLNFLRTKWFWILFIILTIVVYFFGLDIPLLGPDEPRYSQVAREMFDRSDWVTPTLGGYHWFEKPALLYWLQISAYNGFGVNEFAARLGSAIFGLGTIACIWILGRTAYQQDATAEKSLVEEQYSSYFLLAGAATLGLIVFSRAASFDIILTFPIAAALTAFYLYDQADRSRTGLQFGSLAAFYAFVGGSVLAKGLVGIVFPFAIIFFYHLIARKMPAKALILSLFWGLPISLAVLSTWYLPMYSRHGMEFIDEFFIQHHFQRYTSNKYIHPQPFYFFFWVLPLMALPWIPFFFIGFWKAAKTVIGFDGPKPSSQTTAHHSLKLFAFAWCVVPLAFFSFSGSKLPGYILPAVPGAVLLAAISMVAFMKDSAKRSAILKGIGVATFIIVLVLLQFFLPKFAETDSVRHMFRDAEAAGHSSENVVGFKTVSHNMEFYASGRILRADDGKQLRFENAEDIERFIKTKNVPILVLARQEHLPDLQANSGITSEIISRGGDYALVLANTSQ